MTATDPTDPAAVVIEPPEGAAERFRPPVSELATPFWEATRTCRLVLQWCRTCEVAIHYPREACPRCLGTDLEFRPASGRGVVHAVTVVPTAANPTMAGRGAYAVALVELDEGVRFLTNVVDADPWTVAVGAPVSVAWEPLTDGRHLPVFVLCP